MPRRLVQETNVYAGALNPTIGGSNIVSAWDMESGIAGWAGTNAVPTQDSGTKRSGSNSLKVVVSTATGSASYTTPSQLSGKRYYVDFWVLGDSNSNGHFLRITLTANGDGLTQDTVKYKLSNTTWTRIRCSIYNNVTGTITVKIAGVDLSNTWAFWVDDGYMDYVNTPTTSCSSRRFYYNNIETFLRCVNYTNVITGGSSNTDFATEEGMLPFDFADFQTQGCNSIRVYYDKTNDDGTWTTPVANDYGRGLDCAWNYGLGVMVLKYMDLTGTDYSIATGGTNRTAHVNSFKQMVTNLKTHPAVIAYGDGSETNFKLGTNSQNDWFTLIDAACAGGKTIDNSKTYYTSNGGLPIPSQDAAYPNLDMIGYTSYGGNSGQVFRGSDLTVSLNQLIANTSKTVILTEIGCGCYDGSTNGNQEYQATTDVFLLEKTESYYPFFAGHTYFQSEDNRNTQFANDNSWYGKAESLATGAAQSRTRRQAFTAIQNFFLTHSVPAISG